ncbi:hypothetical protein M0804_007623 [Polistes exclamans]|nr:hypothetical protein M0804_007623 [Polistes exclamans]
MRLLPYVDSTLIQFFSSPLEIISESSSESSESMDERKYVPWTIFEERLTNEQYCNFEALIDILRFIKGISFNDFAMRTQSLQLLTNLQRMTLVSKNKRFPDVGINVNVTTGMYAKLLKDLITSLECRRNTIADDVTTTCNCKEIYNLRLNYILHLTNKVPNHQLYYFGVYTQNTFEKWNAIKWV